MKTNAEIAILSLIAERPRHGYEIEQVIEGRGMRDWTEVGFSSIYYLLKKLEGAGLVEARLENPSGRGPARKVYHITQAGREIWQVETLRALSEPQNCYPLIQLGLANLPGVTKEEGVTALRIYCARLAERGEYVRTRREAQRPLPGHVEAMFDLSLTMIETEIEWVSDFIKKQEDQNEKS
jgi:DNA-binding PadR family transcriptional regulator